MDALYTFGELTVATVSVLGNSLVIYVFLAYSRLRSFRNYYIFGLAIADLLIGLVGIPLAIAADGLPANLHGCLFTCSVLVLFCAIGIYCLVAVSVDRFWAVWNPIGYYKVMGLRTVLGILFTCIALGVIVGLLPLFGWYNQDRKWEGVCSFRLIMDYDYLVFVYFGVIVIPAILMAAFYGYIYRFISKRQKKKPQPRPEVRPDPSSQEKLEKDTERSKHKEARAGKKLSSIILFFVVCWMPLTTINCVVAFCKECEPPPWVFVLTIILSHANSAINPFLYAYHLKEFRLAMRNTLYGLVGWTTCGRVAHVTPVPVTSQTTSGL